MKRFAAKAMLAGGLFAVALATAGAAAATEVYLGTDGAGVTAADGSGIMVGQNGIGIATPGPDIQFGQSGVGITAVDGSGITFGPKGLTVSLPGTDHSATPQYHGSNGYGYGYDYGQRYGVHPSIVGPCAPGYCR